MFMSYLYSKLPETGVSPHIGTGGEGDGVTGPEGSANDARFFTGPYQRRLIPIVGHDTPQEAPTAVTAAVLDLIRS
jgi:pimeloyl-ACP methyl ester carboxylesterase